MTESDYWYTVLGARDAGAIVAEFFEAEPDDSDVAGWLEECESIAQSQGARIYGIPQEWRTRAIAEIRAALVAR